MTATSPSATPPPTSRSATPPPTSRSATPPPTRRSATRAVGRLIATEAKLFVREPIGLVFVFAFPVLTVLIIGSSFEPGDLAFGGVDPSAYYIAAYIGVVLAAVGLVMLPVHLASYRERGVMRRFRASSFAPWALPVAWIVVATALTAAAVVALLATAHVAFGVPPVDDVAMTVVAVALGVWASINTGILLGTVLPSARAAQAVGLALFFPSFLLGGAGPPPSVMPSIMRTVAELVPTTHVVKAIQLPWLGVGSSIAPHLVVLVVIGVLTTVSWITLSDRVDTR